MKVVTTKASIQSTRYNKAEANKLGLPENLFKADKVYLDKEGNERVAALIHDAVGKVVESVLKVAKPHADGKAIDADFIRAGVARNIANFNLFAGSGFTAELEERLKADKRTAGIWIEKAEQAAAPTAVCSEVKF